MDTDETLAVATTPCASPSPGPELTIAQADAFRQDLLACLAGGGAFPPLDLGEVERFDTAGVQLLLSLRRSLAGRGEALRLARASDPVAETLAFYGLQSMLPDGAPAVPVPVPASGDRP